MYSDPRKSIALVVLLIALAGLLPLIIHWFAIGNVWTITVRDAANLLNTPGSNAVLVDVRSPAEYQASHIDGAENWHYESIQSLTSKENMPAQFKDKTLLLLCDSGIHSAIAVRKLDALGFANAFNVDGGMQSWTANALHLGSARFASMRLASGETTRLPFRESSANEQLAAFLAGYLIKTIYMVLSFVLTIILLWRQKSLDLAALGWGMIAFFIGETICWINFPIFHEESPLLEYFHSYGMVVCLGFITFAAIEGVDRRILGFSDADAKCALLGLCRGCVKYKPVACGLNRLLKMGIAALICLAVMPLNANPLAVSYNTEIFGLPVSYTHPVVNQLYEMRASPVAAILLLSLSFVILQFGTSRDLIFSKVVFAAGVGHLSFAFLRLALFAFYRDNLIWFAFWEETTELILIGSIAYILWVFRRELVPNLAERMSG